MQQPQVVINIYGGIVQDVFCNDPDVLVMLVDWDTESASDDDENLVNVNLHSGEDARAFVLHYPANSLAEMEGTDVELALQAAQEVSHGPT